MPETIAADKRNQEAAKNDQPEEERVNFFEARAAAASLESPSSETQQSKEEERTAEQDRINHLIGAKALAQVGFETHNREIVDSSFDKARDSGIKLPGKNNERRDLAYLYRLEDMIEQGGEKLEAHLWEQSARKVVVKYENIDKSYWKEQQEIRRGLGITEELTEDAKMQIAKNAQKAQLDSALSWSRYLGSEECPFPLWFKLLAWDGMSKMGALDGAKRRFQKRDASTVMPFPRVNPEVLSKIYSAYSEHYGLEETDPDSKQAADHQRLDNLVSSGSFLKLYAEVLLDGKTIVETPRNPEDVHGQWAEYLPGDEDALAEAAEGTGWCVSSPEMGRHYLSGEKTRFILLKLEDPKSGELATQASASIRLNEDGEVAEISGLREDQMLEDSLIPSVEEKVLQLPGGERYQQAFDDRRHLIELDQKRRSGEAFDKNDIDFLFRHDYNEIGIYNKDKRLSNLRNIDTLLRIGTDPKLVTDDDVVSQLSPEELIQNYELLKANNANVDINKIAAQLDSVDQITHYRELERLGVRLNIKKIIPNLEPMTQVRHLHELVELGADLDIDQIVHKMSPEEQTYYLDDLLKAGAQINIEQLTLGLDSRQRIVHYNTLMNHGVELDLNSLLDDVDKDALDFTLLDMRTLARKGTKIDVDFAKVMNRMDSEQIRNCCSILVELGVPIQEAVKRMEPNDINAQFEYLAKQDISPTILWSKLNNAGRIEHAEWFAERGIHFDSHTIFSRLTPGEQLEIYDLLEQEGQEPNINDITAQMNLKERVQNYSALTEHGAKLGKFYQILHDQFQYLFTD